MGPNPNAVFCGFPSGLARVTVQVATSIPLLRHRPCRDIILSPCSFQLVSSNVTTSISCRDITLFLCRFQLVAHDVATSISCRDNNLRNYKLPLIALGVATSISCRDITLWLCRFHLMVPDVATSISCRDITLWLCRFHLMVPDFATSISCRDISSRNCNFELSTSDVATSVSFRDINLCLWRLHWLFLVSRLQSSVATTAGVTSVSFFFQTCHSFKALLLSRPPSFVATSTSVATSQCCLDIIHYVFG